MKKYSRLLILIIITLFIATGCSEEKINNETTNSVNNKEIINSENQQESKTMKHKKCTRSADPGNGAETELYYDVYYTGEVLNLLISTEKLITEDQSMLDEYEDAYKKISSYYKGLEYYEQKVTRDSSSVTNQTTINYDKIDIQKLLDIEGEEDNIVENGKAKVDLYLALLKRFGGTCEDVE